MSQSNPHITGEFNAHSNLKRCSLITDKGEEIPWCSVVDWQYESYYNMFQKFTFKYKSDKQFSIVMPIENEKFYQQVKWNDRNCKC